MSTVWLITVLLISIGSYASLANQYAIGTHGGGCNRITPAGTFPDHDCDGLADIWETQKFYDANGDGLGVTLPSSVNPNHRDVLVELDAMKFHANSNVISAIDLVKNKFLSAPTTTNPDGSVGANLVVIFDDKNITHSSCTSIWTGFDDITDEWFGTQTERNLNTDIEVDKQDIFHYGVLIHSQCGMPGISGISEIKGNNFVISLGDNGWADSDSDSHPDGNTNQKAATLMHELGHNLNLKHGGSTNTPNCKPNYFSVMNHIYEFSGFVPQPLIDYSNVFGRDKSGDMINESALHEPHGIVGPVGFTGAVGTSIGPPPPNHYKQFNADGSPINYNWVSDSDKTDMNVVNSINKFTGFSPCTDITTGISAGFKDWINIMWWDPPENTENLVRPVQFEGQGNDGNNGTGMLSNNSKNKLLDDPSLPPCDLTLASCNDSPCDPNDNDCKFTVIYNITEPSDPNEDIGNRTAHSTPDVSINDIKKIAKDKVVSIDSIVNSTLANNTQLANQLHKELITDPDGILALIESNQYNPAMVKLLKLRSLIDGSNEFAEKNTIFNAIDDVTNQLRNML